jgi:site-specific DNA-methyltransferase (adenine-specific)
MTSSSSSITPPPKAPVSNERQEPIPEPYYHDEDAGITIYHADCLEIMPTLPDKSIDMILCDLPYGTTACKWDTIIPFEPLWKEYKRLIKNNGAVVLTASQPFTSALVMSNIKWFKYSWVWIKNNVTGLFLAKQRPLKNTEDVLVFSKEITIYNRQMVKRSSEEFRLNYRKNDSVDTKSVHYVSKKTRQSIERQMIKPPIQTLYFNRDVRRDGNNHPTQKPVALFEYLIRTYTNEGDTVLDNCAGSGTTGVACKNLKRKCIEVEIGLEYVEMAVKRLGQGVLPL